MIPIEMPKRNYNLCISNLNLDKNFKKQKHLSLQNMSIHFQIWSAAKAVKCSVA